MNLTKKQLVIKGYEIIQSGEMGKEVGGDSPIEIWASGMEAGKWPDDLQYNNVRYLEVPEVASCQKE